MKRNQFEHAIRAAGSILKTDEVLVIGSQAIHASTDIEFIEAQRSIEVDVAALDDETGEKADLIDGSIGELSAFQESFGYYAQGVTAQTAILPEGWKKRLIAFKTKNTGGVTALCLEAHDLWISKAIANREKDRDFCDALGRLQLVDGKTLKARLNKVKDLESELKQIVQARIDKILMDAAVTLHRKYYKS